MDSHYNTIGKINRSVIQKREIALIPKKHGFSIIRPFERKISGIDLPSK